MTEPDVAITDYLLALECALFVGLLYRRDSLSRAIRDSFALFFASSAIAAIAGGTVHGFFNEPSSATGDRLWRFTMLAVGFSAFALWSLFALLLFRRGASNAIRIIAVIELLAYAVFVLTAKRTFRVAIADYVPPTVMLFIALLVLYAREREPALLAGAVGLALGIGASVLQQQHVGVHPVYFNHNAVYHLLQAVAFFLVFRTAGHVASPGNSAKG
jgi:hypothetical protein